MKPKASLRSTFALITVAVLSSTAARAHHSFAMFDNSKTLEMKGVVKDLQWTNPHVWLDLIVIDDRGNQAVWGFEGQPTNAMMRHGWKRDSVKPGDKVTVSVHPLKDGTHGGSLLGVTLDDGTVLHLGVQGVNPQEAEQ